MKSKCLWLLLAASSTFCSLAAQPTFDYKWPQNSEMIFGAREGFYPVQARFNFFLTKGNKIYFEMRALEQLNYLPDLDSLFTEVKKTIRPLLDSFKTDGLVRRIDFVPTKLSPSKFRVIQHERPFSYTYIDSELVRLKIDSDTLHIQMNTRTGIMEDWVINGVKQKREGVKPFSIYFIVNNLADLEEMPDAILGQCLARLKPETQEYMVRGRKTKFGDRLSGSFYMNGKPLAPEKIKLDQYETSRHAELSILSGLQYARGSFIPSISLGVQYIWTRRKIAANTNYMRLLWEPHFSFSRASDNKLQTHRNDFITLHFTQIEAENTNKKAFDVTGNMSLGYLIKRQGDTFNKHTFKWSFVALTHGSLLLSPELIFNNFFKNVSPSVKLTLWFE